MKGELKDSSSNLVGDLEVHSESHEGRIERRIMEILKQAYEAVLPEGESHEGRIESVD